VPTTPDADDLGDSKEALRIEENLALAVVLVRNTLLNYVHGLGRTVLGYDPLCFLGAGPNDDLLTPYLPANHTPWLSVRRRFEVEVRVIYLDRQPPFVAVVLDAMTGRLVQRSCAELIQDGVLVEGLYVGESSPSTDDPRLAPHFRNLGRVVRVDGSTLELTDIRDRATIPATDALPMRSTEAFRRCIIHYYGSNASQILASIDARLAALRAGPEKLKTLRATLSHLQGLSLELIPGLPFKIGPLLQEGSIAFPPLHELPKPIFVFDPTASRTNTWSDGGLETHGPYDQTFFTPSKPRICVICQRTQKGQVEQFLRKFLDGIPHPGGNRAYFEKGFIRKYALESTSPEFFLAESGTAAAYRHAAEAAIRQQTDRGTKWDLALVQIEERFHDLHGDENPYLVTKAELLTHQIPSQEFEIETAAQRDRQLQYSLNNMALATYAKLGGIPWLLRANPTIAHELVIGLGSANIGSGLLGQRERVVGITTVFAGDGNYYLSTLSQAVPIDEYRTTLLSSLEETIRSVSRDMNWKEKDPVRIIFHAFKPMKDIEVDAVKSLVQGLGAFDLEYAFIHVVQDPGYILFDELQPGVSDFETKRTKGACAPQRGWFFRLSNHEVLLTLTGARDVKRPEDGLPRPVLLRLHRDSTFTDTTYLARQAFAFASHSWRSFFPSSLPVTITYSQLLAHMLGQLGTVSRWNPNVMLGRVGRTRWFL